MGRALRNDPELCEPLPLVVDMEMEGMKDDREVLMGGLHTRM